ncbi:hypothetical protein BIFGAL_03255 [Bifidobacterium gallicum DSM 20093 = LMG 11596]|uniref:Uncharacterized protein n=1 Tax=Bifidobacterium gallicum DSM 20093 = LMG 11596 TaxID=561180 RepID=D1NTT7_9BIFI|nr:hypothetical protein BIFGAL_03255 [Bifidobacterium gallicum DSM 20093 = LMG 11596]
MVHRHDVPCVSCGCDNRCRHVATSDQQRETPMICAHIAFV